MIKLYDGSGQEVKFETTTFPDKSSQVWKMDFKKVLTPTVTDFKIVWTFENEAELIHVMQLATLVTSNFGKLVDLEMPYLVYGRQDKGIENYNTFALHTFMRILKSSGMFARIWTVDAHSKVSSSYGVVNIDPSDRIQEVLSMTDTTLICFPDKGASDRGYKYNYDTYGAPIILDKNRDQSTGEILGLKFASKLIGTGMLKGHSVLVADDIFDGGKTFIEAAKLLKSAGAAKVYVYTTHGIYSKGTDIAFAAGIDRVFNYKGEVPNLTNPYRYEPDDIPF